LPVHIPLFSTKIITGSILRIKYVKKYQFFQDWFFSAVFLQACGNKVDCNNSDVKDDVVIIIQEQLDKALWYREMSMGIAEKSALSTLRLYRTMKN